MKQRVDVVVWVFGKSSRRVRVWRVVVQHNFFDDVHISKFVDETLNVGREVAKHDVKDDSCYTYTCSSTGKSCLPTYVGREITNVHISYNNLLI